ncbi:hypothetical protein H4R18_004570 [Coemansia javaensis]|uniref:DUF2470 domain-containing protein n=1 Tax=Coemansia javaensis TaxID=2761396 RepID=A0A9W8H7D9_9FUNG|nr:hypothetical protein H4R18_004570 [Coemansia javaensis]
MSRQRQRAQQAQRRAEKQEQEEGYARLKGQLNAAYSADVLDIARHFGAQPLADAARVVDIDGSGMRVEWSWAGAAGERLTDETTFMFRAVDGVGAALHEVSALAAKAASALGRTEKPRLVGDREALAARTLVDFAFVPPPAPAVLAVGAGLAALWHVATADAVVPALAFARAVASRDTWHYALVAVVGLHAIEALAACAVCQLIKTFQPRQMTTATQLQWTVGGALFGMVCLHALVKKVARQLALVGAMPQARPARPPGT